MAKFESQKKAFYILVYLELKTNWGGSDRAGNMFSFPYKGMVFIVFRYALLSSIIT